eukprot:NODE_6949_length_483_cov_21.373596_g6783_i0.p2 GENE.NODE_6949_length_483_cov_21.373596_g6783_i0~~NODE_6949_length_483_cov_21.373596_g6783_i0.p2  ORF type:complete len:100 (-),score=21.44 NODE_6949_length_483_cov_21.373596_g6783_i0:127-426(-)
MTATDLAQFLHEHGLMPYLSRLCASGVHSLADLRAGFEDVVDANDRELFRHLLARPEPYYQFTHCPEPNYQIRARSVVVEITHLPPFWHASKRAKGVKA